MSAQNPDRAIAPPSAFRIVCSGLLLALFAPVVLAVGSADFRPGWLADRVSGIPLSIVWEIASIAAFIVLTWLFSRMDHAQAREGQGQ